MILCDYFFSIYIVVFITLFQYEVNPQHVPRQAEAVYGISIDTTANHILLTCLQVYH